MHYDIIAAVLPTIAVLAGILVNSNDYSKMETRLNAELGRLDARITQLENRLHSDMVNAIGKLSELEVRVARLEEKASK